MNETQRGLARKRFLVSQGLHDLQVKALKQDASFRRYFRVMTAKQSFILMDAPPAREDVTPFVRIAQHLLHLGLRAPKILAANESMGFVLLEDFGDDTFTRLLKNDANEEALYRAAIKVLHTIHQHPLATSLTLSPYDETTLIKEAELFLDWYLAAKRRQPIDRQIRQSFIEAWKKILRDLPDIDTTLVLRDFHVDNLMLVKTGNGQSDCGLLDFQDALAGPAAYDVASLLEDARRDIETDFRNRMLDLYLEKTKTPEATVFRVWYDVLAAQRHCKVAGIFVRLCVRDDKPDYLIHIPRVISLLDSHLHKPHLGPLRLWLDEYGQNWRSPLPNLGSVEMTN